MSTIINGIGRVGIRQTISAPSTPTYPIITSGLNLYYDISNPTCYPGSGTSITDLSGNGNTGTLVNGVAYSSLNGGQLIFDGVNDTVDIPHSTSLIKTTNGALFLYVKLQSTNNQVLIGKGDIYSDRKAYGMYTYSSSEYVEIANTTSAIQVGSAPLTVGTWRQVGMVWNGSTLKKYINGVEVSSISQTINVVDDGRIMRIGGRMTYGTPYSDMCFGEVYLYDTLTPSEITANFNATKTRYGL
jgi:hypothetical protein